MEDYNEVITKTILTYYQKLGELYTHKEVDKRIEEILQKFASQMCKTFEDKLEQAVKKAICENSKD